MTAQSAFWMGRNDWHHARKADRAEEVGEFRKDYLRGFKQAAAEDNLDVDTEWDQ
jgi:hypothetical protein